MAGVINKSNLVTGDTIFINEREYDDYTIPYLKTWGYWYTGKILKDDSGIWILTQDANSCVIESYETYWENAYQTVVWQPPNGYTTEAKNALWTWGIVNAGRLQGGRQILNEGDTFETGRYRVFPKNEKGNNWPIPLKNNDAANGSLVQYLNNLLMGWPMYNYPDWTGDDLFQSINDDYLFLIGYQ